MGDLSKSSATSRTSIIRFERCSIFVQIRQEPVCKFLACLEQHALVRELSSITPYWVCAYANNQHCVEEDIKSNPRRTSFFKAMQMSQGVLLVLDSAGTPFERIWCCFEEAIAAALECLGGARKHELYQHAIS